MLNESPRQIALSRANAAAPARLQHNHRPDIQPDVPIPDASGSPQDTMSDRGAD